MKYPPLHMNIYERNARLYEFLVSMGHIVSPILVEGTENIKHIYVTVGSFPDHSGQCTEAGINTSVQGTQITESVCTAETNRNTVIDFPSKR